MNKNRIPLWALATEKPNRYGSIADLPDEELADPEELERQVFLQEWGPILQLPVRGASAIRPDIDENGGVDWGAFGTVDFERISPKLDKARYKLDKLREELRTLHIMLDTARYRVQGENKYTVLRYARQGIIDVDDILDEELRGLAKLCRRADRLEAEIRRLSLSRRKRRLQETAAMLARWE